MLLSGFVATEQQAKCAAELAAGVGGVVTVKNGLIANG
jgi:osmotically-inducible protein OsmY